MKIEFLHDHQGRETDERFFAAGEVAELDDQWAGVLVANGHARAVVDAPPVKETAPVSAKGKK
jgi:hypothetical protein